MGGNSFKRWLYLINHQPTYFDKIFFYQRRLLKIQMVGELYCQTLNDRTNKVITINWIHSSKSTKGFYNFQGKFWILKIWIDIMTSHQKVSKFDFQSQFSVLMSLVANWFGRVEFRIFDVVFYRQAQLKKSKQIFKFRNF